MTVRMLADEHGIPLASAATTVALDRSATDEVVFEYTVDSTGS